MDPPSLASNATPSLSLEDSLPSIQDVLDRLKSDGTFDQFRKVCLSAIEEEVSKFNGQ
jgi:hypothetical protein